MTSIAIAGFVIAGLLGTYRLLAGPTLADRVVALDVTIISLMGAITVDAASSDDPTDLILLVVLAIIGFTATVAASQFIELDREPDSRSQDAEPQDDDSQDNSAGQDTQQEAGP